EQVLSLRSAGTEKKSEAHFHLAKIKAFSSRFDDARFHLSEITKNLKDNLANDALEILLLMNTAKNDSSNLLLFCEGELLVERMLFNDAKERYYKIADDKRAFVFHSIANLRLAQMDIALNEYQSAIEILVSVAA